MGDSKLVVKPVILPEAYLVTEGIVEIEKGAGKYFSIERIFLRHVAFKPAAQDKTGSTTEKPALFSWLIKVITTKYKIGEGAYPP